jgi:hypothetical protein
VGQPYLANPATIWSFRRCLAQSQPPSTRQSIIWTCLLSTIEPTGYLFYGGATPRPTNKNEKKERNSITRAGEVNVAVLALAHKDVSNSSRMGTTIFEDLYIIHALQYATNCLEQPSKRQPKYHKKVFLKNENK